MRKLAIAIALLTLTGCASTTEIFLFSAAGIVQMTVPNDACGHALIPGTWHQDAKDCSNGPGPNNGIAVHYPPACYAAWWVECNGKKCGEKWWEKCLERENAKSTAPKLKAGER